jgi:hypothetical protein
LTKKQGDTSPASRQLVFRRHTLESFGRAFDAVLMLAILERQQANDLVLTGGSLDAGPTGHEIDELAYFISMWHSALSGDVAGVAASSECSTAFMNRSSS